MAHGLDVKGQPPAVHILSNFESSQPNLLMESHAFRKFIDVCITRHQLNKVGEAFHDFEGGGFTAVICLAESHLSIHTWPDRNYATFDIFLSNHTMDNSARGRAVYTDVLDFFDGTVLLEKTVLR